MADKRQYQPGDHVRFRGYEDKAAEQNIEPGSRIIIHEIMEAGGYKVEVVDAQGKPTGVADHVFDEEIEAENAKSRSKGKKAATHLRVVDVDPQTGDPLADASSPAALEAGSEPGTLPAVASAPGRTASVDAAIRTAGDAIQAAKDLANTIEVNYFTFGGLLAEIYDNTLFTALGYDGKRGWATFLERELGVDYRRAMYWVSIYKGLSAVGINENKVASLGGWSKAKEIARLLKARDGQGRPVGEQLLLAHFDELAQVAATRTREELHDAVELKLLEAKGDEPARHSADVMRKTFKVRLPAGHLPVVSRILAVARERLKLDDDASALEAILTEWAKRHRVNLEDVEADAAIEGEDVGEDEEATAAE